MQNPNLKVNLEIKTVIINGDKTDSKVAIINGYNREDIIVSGSNSKCIFIYP